MIFEAKILKLVLGILTASQGGKQVCVQGHLHIYFAVVRDVCVYYAQISFIALSCPEYYSHLCLGVGKPIDRGSGPNLSVKLQTKSALGNQWNGTFQFNLVDLLNRVNFFSICFSKQNNFLYRVPPEKDLLYCPTAKKCVLFVMLKH